MSSTVVAAVVWFSVIVLVPNVIDLVLVLLELNAPVVKLNPANANVPAVNVYVQVAANVNDALNVTVLAVCTKDGVVIVPPL